MLTADRNSNYIHKIVSSGADDILAKPLAPNISTNQIHILTLKRKVFVVTSDYFDPDRRDNKR